HIAHRQCLHNNRAVVLGCACLVEKSLRAFATRWCRRATRRIALRRLRRLKQEPSGGLLDAEQWNPGYSWQGGCQRTTSIRRIDPSVRCYLFYLGGEVRLSFPRNC